MRRRKPFAFRFSSVAAPALAIALLGGRARAQPAADSSVDCSASFNDGWTLRDAQRLKEARARFLACTEPVCPSFVSHCTAAVAEVSAAIPSVIFTVLNYRGEVVPDVAVTVDGVPIESNPPAASIEVDPGRHTFGFTSPGYAAASLELVLPAGRKDQPESVTLMPAAAPVSKPLVSEEPQTTALAAPRTPDRSPSPSSFGSQKTLAVVVGGAGIAALAVGAWFGVRAVTTYSDAKRECALSCKNNDPAQGDYDTALHDANVSTILFVAGGAATAAGALLWLLAPRAKTAGAVQVAPSLSAGRVGLELAGEF